MFATRRVTFIAVSAVVIWYLVVVVFWALQPLSDSVPVGIDYTKSPPAPASVTVECQTLFDSSPRSDAPLPPLKAQPPKAPALGYQREPCNIVQHHARIVFALDTVAFLAVIVGFGWLKVRRRRPDPVDQPKPDPTLSLVSS